MAKRKKSIPEIIQYLSRRSGLIFLIAIAFFLIIFFIFGDRGTIHLMKSQSEKKKLENQIEQLEAKKDSLAKEKNQLLNDPHKIEKIAREKYKMKKDGEKTYQIEEKK